MNTDDTVNVILYTGNNILNAGFHLKPNYQTKMKAQYYSSSYLLNALFPIPQIAVHRVGLIISNYSKSVCKRNGKKKKKSLLSKPNLIEFI